MGNDPLFLPESLLRRSTTWTPFETDLFNLFGRHCGASRLYFSKRLRVVEAMRAAGAKELEAIEEEENGQAV